MYCFPKTVFLFTKLKYSSFIRCFGCFKRRQGTKFQMDTELYFTSLHDMARYVYHISLLVQKHISYWHSLSWNLSHFGHFPTNILSYTVISPPIWFLPRWSCVNATKMLSRKTLKVIIALISKAEFLVNKLPTLAVLMAPLSKS